jgi:hypothetical protein
VQREPRPLRGSTADLPSKHPLRKSGQNPNRGFAPHAVSPIVSA